MNIVFIGASRFGARILDVLTTIDGCTLVGAVTSEEVFKISYSPTGVRNVLHADIRERCDAIGIPVLTLRSGMNDVAMLREVTSWRPDAFIVAGWYHMVPKSWRDLAPAYGLHASLLPDYSGGAPLVWAIINGETKTGISFFQLAGGVDDGPLIGQRSTDIGADETIGDVYARIEDLGVELVRNHVPEIAKGTASAVPQDESRRRTFPQRSPADGKIDWGTTAKAVHDFVRAQTRPYPGAFFFHGEARVIVWEGRVYPGTTPGLRTGEWVRFGDAVVVGCGDDNGFELLNVQQHDAPQTGVAWFDQHIGDAQ